MSVFVGTVGGQGAGSRMENFFEISPVDSSVLTDEGEEE